MTNRSCFIMILFLILIYSPTLCEEVTPYGSDRFITGKIVASATSEAGERVLIHSSPNLSGKLIITAEPIDSAVLEVKMIAKTDSRSTADEYTEVTDVAINRTRKGLEILFRTPNPAPWAGSDESVMIEGELHLPEDCQLNIKTDYFDLDIEGPFVSVENDKTYGRLDISNITKIIDLTGSNRDISLKNITGDVAVSLSHADIWIDDMKTEYRAARVYNEYGNINIDGFEGGFEVKDSFGKIRLTDIKMTDGKSKIEAEQCPIHLSIGSLDKTELYLSDSYEDIFMDLPDTVTADFYLKTEDIGEIHLKDIPVRAKVIESNYAELSSGRGGSVIRAGIEGGGNIVINGYTR